MRNALVLREDPHPPVFRQKGVPVMMGKSQGKAIHEQQVRYGEWKAQLEHPVEQIPLGKLDQHGAVADEDLHGELVRCPHHDALDFTDPQIQQFGGFGF